MSSAIGQKLRKAALVFLVLVATHILASYGAMIAESIRIAVKKGDARLLIAGVFYDLLAPIVVPYEVWLRLKGEGGSFGVLIAGYVATAVLFLVVLYFYHDDLIGHFRDGRSQHGRDGRGTQEGR